MYLSGASANYDFNYIGFKTTGKVTPESVCRMKSQLRLWLFLCVPGMAPI